MWRAYLADGRVVEYDGDNSPQHLLPLIVRFEVFAANGAKIGEVDPGPRDRVIFRRIREITDGVVNEVGVKLGVLNLDSMEFDAKQWDGRHWEPTRDLVLTPEERDA